MTEAQIEIEHASVVSFASSHNGAALVQELVVRSPSRTYQDVQVSVELESLGQRLAEPWVERIPMLGPLGSRWDDLRLRLDAAALFDLDDQREGRLVVTVEGDGRELASTSRDVSVLAANTWTWDEPSDDFAMMLPAFVMPNHPALRKVLDLASQRLAEQGRSSGLSGYQNQDHVAPMVEAIYESVRSLSITYVDPPASWDLYSAEGHPIAQRVRTPGEVLGDRAGTCLDTAVLFAALLENVGLKPVLAMVPGHAFVGYWKADREDLAFPDPVMPVSEVINHSDSGNIVLFETTAVCGGQDSLPFDEAIVVGRRRISSPQSLTGSARQSRFIDVAQARWKRRVLPIPARVVHPDGRVEVVEYKPQELTISLLQRAVAAAGASTRAGLRQQETPVRIRRWKDALLDLSFRNPLINYRAPAASSLGLFVPPGSLGTIEDLLQSGYDLTLQPNVFVGRDGNTATLDARGQFDSNLNEDLVKDLVGARRAFTTATPDTFLTRVRRIASLAKVGREDNGVNDLYLGLGMLHWQPEGRRDPVRSPLILVPVVLTPFNRGREFRLSIDETGIVTPNFSLAEKLAQDVNLKLPKLVEPELDGAGVDIDGLIAYVRNEITTAGLQGFRVDESAVLGFFDFSTYRLWRDLTDHWPSFLDSRLVKHLVETPNLPFGTQERDPASSLEDLDQLTSQLPIATDGSQASAVARAMAGETFVLQGPPGTGKSQTITNLLARGLHLGKRILFIAEKTAALSVVKDRLESVGLTAFCLDLHDKGMRPTAVRQQLLAVLDIEVPADRIGHESAERELARSLVPLQSYPHRLHARGKFGESVYSARVKLLSNRAEQPLPVPSRFLVTADQAVRERIGRELLALGDLGEGAGTARSNPWALATVDRRQLDAGALQRIGVAVDIAVGALRTLQISPVGVAFLEGAESFDEIAEAETLAAAASHGLHTLDAAASVEQRAARRKALAELQAVDDDRFPPELAPAAIDAPVDSLRVAAEQARRSFFLGRKKRLEAVCRQVEPYLFQATPLPSEHLEQVIQTIGAAQDRARALRASWASLIGIELEPTINPLIPERRAQVKAACQSLGAAVDALAANGTSARQRLRDLATQGTSATEAASALARAVTQLRAELEVTDSSLLLWRGPDSLGDRLIGSSAAWQRDRDERNFTLLTRWAALHEGTAVLRDHGLHEAERLLLSGGVRYRDADEAFERGFLSAVLGEQFDEERLDTFDGQAQDASVRTFQRASKDLRASVPAVVAADIIGARGFQSGVSVGAVGELRRELNRTRRGKPIRRLLSDHWDVITRLTPCVLASPDSIARFLPADLEKFDLVVFDEASQIKVPHAIGALGRARSAVVVGDSKQMPPTSIAERSQPETDIEVTDDEATIDEESILSESVQARVPDLMLTWHYRSEDESLIAFSNQQYYDGRLSTFPSALSSVEEKGLSFVKVEGRQAGRAGERTNPVEAEAIVQEIARRLHHPVLSKFSIGVVTFNKPQQLLILEMLQSLEDELVQQSLEASGDEGVLVRNLESVQGQERDVVLFSVGASKNANGVVPTNFGPLNRVGGERRLNVAVTRARRQVIVYCSFEPQELVVERSSSQGLRHLRTYLELARFGPEASGAVSGQQVRSPDRHRDEILHQLGQAGLKCEPDVGLSDFKVDIAVNHPDDPNRRVLALLLDGEKWERRVTVSDRDSLPNEVLLRKMGWKAVERIWLPTWLRDRAGEIERIKQRVHELVELDLEPPVEEGPDIRPDAHRGVPFRSAAIAAPVGAVDQGNGLDWSDVPTWAAWPVREVGASWYLDRLTDPWTLRHVQDLAERVVEAEGPIAPERFGRLIGQAHSLQRVTTRRVQEISNLHFPRLHRDDEGFLFPPETPPHRFTSWKRSEPGQGRAVEEISFRELGNAMSHIARVGLGISAEDLVRLTAQAFGIGRVTVGIRARLEVAIERAVAEGQLVRRGEYLSAAVE